MHNLPANESYQLLVKHVAKVSVMFVSVPMLLCYLKTINVGSVCKVSPFPWVLCSWGGAWRACVASRGMHLSCSLATSLPCNPSLVLLALPSCNRFCTCFPDEFDYEPCAMLLSSETTLYAEACLLRAWCDDGCCIACMPICAAREQARTIRAEGMQKIISRILADLILVWCRL